MAESFRTLVDLYQRSQQRYADRPLFGVRRDGRYAWMTYREVGALVDRLRGGLATLGVGRGDTVAVISDNRVEWAAGAYATAGLGARYCPMYEAQQPEEWRYILGDGGAKVALTSRREIYDQVRGFAGELPALERVVHFDPPDDGPDHLSALLALGDARSHPPAEVATDDVCSLIYTSGTTGKPKGVLLTHGNLASNVSAVHRLDILRTDDVSLAFLPWAHVFGQVAELHLLVSYGAALGLVEDVSKLVEALGEVRPTLLFSVPRVFTRIHEGLERRMEEESALVRGLFHLALDNALARTKAREDGRSLPLRNLLHGLLDPLVFRKVRQRFGGRLRFAVSGGAKLQRDVAYFIDALGIVVLEGYGLTETSPLISVNLPTRRKIGSVGPPIPGVEVSIAPVEEAEVGVGEVLVKGPNVMRGYHQRPAETAEVLDPDGTFHTGDLGSLDDDGFLWIHGRVKEQFKLENGKYVVPTPLEEDLKISRYVDQVMIEGTNRPYTVALISVAMDNLRTWAEEHGVPGDGLLANPEVQELFRRELAAHSASFKRYEVPADFRLVEEAWTVENGLLTPTLKVKRRALLARYGELIESMYGG